MQKNDFDTPTWDRFTASVRQRIETLRMQNEGDLDVLQTAKLRGRISELKRILGLASAGPEHEADSTGAGA